MLHPASDIDWRFNSYMIVYMFQCAVLWETVETVSDFIVLDSKITADGDCSHEIKKHLMLGRKAMTNLDSIVKKQRYYIANKGSI